MNISKTLYVREKTKGGRVRYTPIAEGFPRDAFGAGVWIVHVEPGRMSSARAVMPDKPGVSAAIEEAREAMLDALREASRTRKAIRPLTGKEKKAYLLYEKACRETGIDVYPITVSSATAYDIIDAALKVLATEVVEEVQ